MKCALVHSYYRQRGGEEEVLRAEMDLLRAHGHAVASFTGANEDLVSMGPARKAATTIWNPGTYRRFREFLRDARPDVIHVHNTFPALSPAVYHAASAEGIPVVQTLHNYRLLCANGLFFRDGKVCEACIDRSFPWPGIVHSCYRDSAAASAVAATMIGAHRLAGTWTGKVSLYIALTEFAREKFVRGGLPADRVVTKPNFVPDPGPPGSTREDFALFVGRLSPEKGVRTMLNAWRALSDVPLRIVGGGPLREEMEQVVSDRAAYPRVELLGPRPQEEVLRMMKRARFLIFPSEWYEGAPRVVLEAFACGLPVIGARIGAMTEILDDGLTGRSFEPGSVEDLVDCVRSALGSGALEGMGANARREYERRYDPESNYARLMELYRIAGADGGSPAEHASAAATR